MAVRLIKKRIRLFKPKRRRLLRLFAATLPPPPIAPPVNPDFLVLFKRARPLRRKKRPRRSSVRRRAMLAFIGVQIRPVAVPNLVGDTTSAAFAACLAVGLLPDANFVASLTVPAGKVIDQIEIAGHLVSPGTTIHFDVSTGAALVPQVLNFTLDAAVAAIVAVGLVPSIESRPVPGPSNIVIAQEPPPQSLALVGSTVFLVVSAPVLPGQLRAKLPSPQQDLVNVTVTLQ